MRTDQFKLVEKLLVDLQSESEETRINAEKQFNVSFANNCNDITRALSHAACESQKTEVRVMANILLRRNVFTGSTSCFPKLDSNAKDALKASCLKLLQGETQIPVRRQVVALAGSLADRELSSGGWPDLLPALEQLCKSPNGEVRGDAFYLFGLISSGEGVGKAQKSNFITLFLNGLKDGDLGVRLKSLDAFVTFSQSLDEQDNPSAIMETVLNLFRDVLGEKDSSHLTGLIETLIDLASLSSWLFKNHLETFVKLMASAIMQKNLGDGDRMLAMEFLVMLTEEDNGMFRRSASFVEMCFMAALALMMELSDNNEWINQLEEDEIEEEEMYGEGEMALDRLAQVFGSDRVVSVAMPLVLKFLEDSDWKKRLVGLMAISQMGESIDETHLEKLVGVVTRFFKDPHPRVVFSAIHCIGQMSEDFSPEIQKLHHSKILPDLVRILKNPSMPKIQAHAGAAIVNFVESIDSEILAIYLEELLSILFQLMPNSHCIVREQIVTIIASMASSVPPQFHMHLERIVPILLENYLNAKNKDQIIYKCKCLEALTFIGVELKPAAFANVAHQLMKSTLLEVNQVRPFNVDYYDFVLQAWIRIAKILKKDFAPYLPNVMAHLMETLKEKDESPKAGIEMNSDSDEDYVPDSADINEIESACCALSVLPVELGPAFLPFLTPSIQAANTMLEYWGEENVRSYAARSLGALFTTVVNGVQINQLAVSDAVICLEKFFTTLIKCYVDESEMSTKKSILKTLKTLLELDEKLSNGFLSMNNNDEKMFKSLLNMLEIVKIRVDKLNERKNKTDNDKEQISRYEAVLEDENEHIFSITEVFGLLVKIRKESARELLDKHLEQFVHSLSNKSTAMVTKKAVLLITDDVLLYAPRLLQKYSPLLGNLFINYLNEDDLDIKQAAVFGLGLLAENYPQVFKENCQKVMEICINLYKVLAGRKESRVLPLKDNVASAYGRIAFACAEFVALNKTFPVWLSMLPLESDLTEVKKSSEVLLKVLATGKNDYSGEKMDDFGRILNILGENVAKVKLGEESRKQLEVVVSKIKALSAEQQAELVKKISQKAREMLSGGRKE